MGILLLSHNMIKVIGPHDPKTSEYIHSSVMRRKMHKNTDGMD